MDKTRRFPCPAKCRTAFFAALTLFALCLTGIACKHGGSHSSDRRLQSIEDSLDERLPQGSTRSRVIYYMKTRAYEQEATPHADEVVAIIHHIDPETLQPVTARARFHFDAGDKLKFYDIEVASDAP